MLYLSVSNFTGAAAMLATQLDDFLGGDPIQYRETQQHESEIFKSYFKSGITLVLTFKQ